MLKHVDLAEVVADYKAHNDRRERDLIASGVLPDRPSLAPPSSNASAQIRSIIAAAERRLPKMGLEARVEVQLLLKDLKALVP